MRQTFQNWARSTDAIPTLKQKTRKSAHDIFKQKSGSDFFASEKIQALPSNTLIKSHQLIQTPQSDTGMQLSLTHSISSQIFVLNDDLSFTTKPLLMEAPAKDLPELFVSKCRQCCQICDFTSSERQVTQKADKSLILTDIREAIAKTTVVEKFTEKEYAAVYDMFKANVVRTTPNPPDIWFSPCCIDFQLDKVEEMGWCHMSIVYDIVIQLISSKKFNTKLCERRTRQLMKNIIHLFRSPDNREREKLVKLLYVFYSAFRNDRKTIRTLIGEYIEVFLTTQEPQLGISEILSAMLPIIKGFTVPLAEEHIVFFKQCLLPLHYSPHLHFYFAQLTQAVCAVLDKNPNLVPNAFNAIFDHWPLTAPTKQILLLQELEVLVNWVLPCHEEVIMRRFGSLLKWGVCDEHFAVAERSLMIWESDTFMRLLVSNAKMLFPMIIPELFKTTRNHWCEDVRALALNALRVFKGACPDVFDSVGKEFTKTESEKALQEMWTGANWIRLVGEYCEPDKTDALKKHVASIYIGCEALAEDKSIVLNP